MQKITIKIILFLLAMSISISARADLSQKTLEEASHILVGNCYALFSGQGYQDYPITFNKVFVFGENEKGQQECAFQGGGMLRYSHEELKDLACRQISFRKCFLFAKDNNIVSQSVTDLIGKADELFKLNKNEEASKVIDEIYQRSERAFPERLRGKFYYLTGLRSYYRMYVSSAIDDLTISWSKYRYEPAAKKLLDIISSSQDIQTNWEAIRGAYLFIRERNDESTIKKYKQMFVATEIFYLKDQADKEKERILAQETDRQNKEIAEKKAIEQERQRLVDEKESLERAVLAEKDAKVRAKNEAKEAKERAKNEAIELKIAKEQERKRLADEAKEAKKIAELQRLDQLKAEKEAKEADYRRLAEEKRLAREGDGSPDDYACKSFGAKPGTDSYVKCRYKLVEQDNQRQTQQLQQAQQKAFEEAQIREENRRVMLQAEQERRYQEQLQNQQRLEAQRQQAQAEKLEEADRRSGWEMLFRGLQMMGSQPGVNSVSPSPTRFLRSQYYSNGNHMCNYDDGSVLNVGAGMCPNSR